MKPPQFVAVLLAISIALFLVVIMLVGMDIAARFLL